MNKNTSRPVFLNLLQIRMPAAALMSIAHRISGFGLFLAIPLLIYVLDLSLRSPRGFQEAAELLGSLPVKLLLLGLGWALIHHFLAGIRFLLLDLDIGIEAATARRSAWLVNGLALALTGLLAWGWLL